MVRLDSFPPCYSIAKSFLSQAPFAGAEKRNCAVPPLIHIRIVGCFICRILNLQSTSLQSPGAWVGTAPVLCSKTCPTGKVQLYTDASGDGSWCLFGEKKYCVSSIHLFNRHLSF